MQSILEYIKKTKTTEYNTKLFKYITEQDFTDMISSIMPLYEVRNDIDERGYFCSLGSHPRCCVAVLNTNNNYNVYWVFFGKVCFHIEFYKDSHKFHNVFYHTSWRYTASGFYANFGGITDSKSLQHKIDQFNKYLYLD